MVLGYYTRVTYILSIVKVKKEIDRVRERKRERGERERERERRESNK